MLDPRGRTSLGVSSRAGITSSSPSTNLTKHTKVVVQQKGRLIASPHLRFYEPVQDCALAQLVVLERSHQRLQRLCNFDELVAVDDVRCI